MSESLFLLLCALCVYGARKGRWLAGCLFGALAAFTRSLGLMLFVPLLIELVPLVKGEGMSRLLKRFAALLVPLGFGAYCLINAYVAGHPFKFFFVQASAPLLYRLVHRLFRHRHRGHLAVERPPIPGRADPPAAGPGLPQPAPPDRPYPYRPADTAFPAVPGGLRAGLAGVLSALIQRGIGCIHAHFIL